MTDSLKAVFIIFSPVFIFLLILHLVIVAILLITNFQEKKRINEYMQSTYAKQTHLAYKEVLSDTGRFGEWLCYKKLESYEKDGGRFLFNCYLPTNNGKTTEVDMILIHKSGVYVLESKNYSGWIFGDEKNRNWTQSFKSYHGKAHKERFFNPVMQNMKHIEWIKRHVGEVSPIYSIVVFSERCKLMDVHVNESHTKVIKRKSLKALVDAGNIGDEKPISEERVEEIFEILYPFTQVSEDVKLKHIADINEEKRRNSKPNEDQAVFQNSQLISDKRICPRCGNKLVLRKATKGENKGNSFWGCTAYPKCRYIDDIVISKTANDIKSIDASISILSQETGEKEENSSHGYISDDPDVLCVQMESPQENNQESSQGDAL